MIHHLANHLLLNDYLYLTNEQYAVLKLTGTSLNVLEGETTIIMKFPKEIKKDVLKDNSANKKKKSGLAKGKNSEDIEVDEILFEKLRELRLNIAKEEKVPPYIVFSDKTLKEMSFKKPMNEAKMLEVSGIGKFKFDKYGEQFMEVIKTYK